MLVYNYSRKEDSKEITEEIVVGNITTTYIGRAKRETYNGTDDYAKPIWSITKYVEDVSTGTGIKSRPNKSLNFEFIRNDRASLDYV